MCVEGVNKIGLDQYLYRRELPIIPTDMNERIIVELEDDKDNEEGEEVFCWRKDYELQDFFHSLSLNTRGKQVENCEEFILDKELFKRFLEYFEKNNEEQKDYDKEISQLKDVLEHDTFENVEYCYYAWW